MESVGWWFSDGKYRREDTSNTGRLSGANPFGDSKFADRNWDILTTLKEVAAEVDSDPAAVALAWVMGRPGVASTIVGARTVAQLHGNLAAAKVVLSADQVARLDKVSAPTGGFFSANSAPFVRSLVYGVDDVRSWQG